MRPAARFVFLAFALVTTVSVAQTPVEVFRTKEGKIYSAKQRDSLLLAKHPVGTISTTVKGDTSFVDIEVYPKRDPRGTAFVQKYKGQKLPNFQLRTLDGKLLTAASLRGKVVMLNFWSTTCGPCIAEIPELNKLKNDHQNVVFLAPAPENAATVKQFLQRQPFAFTILPGAKQLFKDWGIDGYPKNFFVDKNGIIQEVKEGTPVSRASEQAPWAIAVRSDYTAIIKSLASAKH
jgi:thiol-disulfide isomerase/thioredoxin